MIRRGRPSFPRSSLRCSQSFLVTFWRVTEWQTAELRPHHISKISTLSSAVQIGRLFLWIVLFFLVVKKSKEAHFLLTTEPFLRLLTCPVFRNVTRLKATDGRSLRNGWSVANPWMVFRVLTDGALSTTVGPLRPTDGVSQRNAPQTKRRRKPDGLSPYAKIQQNCGFSKS